MRPEEEAIRAAEHARAVQCDQRNAVADMQARQTYAALAALCGADLDAEHMTRETIAGVSYGVPALVVAIEALAARVSALEANE